jgi:acyl-CoA thioester hydrolase
MEKFSKPVQLRWSDMDPNFHIRHSVYYDWGAMCRIDFLTQYGLTPAVMQQYSFGPIIFREECVFRKEIKFEGTTAAGLFSILFLKTAKHFVLQLP